MGKILDNYIEQYNDALASGSVKEHEYIVCPDIWITFKWEQDNDFLPFNQRYIEKYKELISEDPEMAEMVAKGTFAASEVMNHVERTEFLNKFKHIFKSTHLP